MEHGSYTWYILPGQYCIYGLPLVQSWCFEGLCVRVIGCHVNKCTRCFQNFVMGTRYSLCFQVSALLLKTFLLAHAGHKHEHVWFLWLLCVTLLQLYPPTLSNSEHDDWISRVYGYKNTFLHTGVQVRAPRNFNESWMSLNHPTHSPPQQHHPCHILSCRTHCQVCVLRSVTTVCCMSVMSVMSCLLLNRQTGHHVVSSRHQPWASMMVESKSRWA